MDKFYIDTINFFGIECLRLKLVEDIYVKKQ